MNKNEVVNILRESFDIELIANFIGATKGQLTKKKDRHLLSQIRDSLYERFSCGKIIHIDEDGADLYHASLDSKIEIKHSNDGFLYSPVIKKPRESIKKIIFKNTNSNNKNYSIKSLILGIICSEPHCLSFIFFDDLQKFLCNKKTGQILAKNIPREFFHILKDYNEIKFYDIKFPLENNLTNWAEEQITNFAHELTIARNSSKTYDPNKGDVMKRDNSTKKAYELIEKSNLEEIDANKVRGLFENCGVQKSLAACSKYLLTLVNKGLLSVEKTTTKGKAKKNIYKIKQKSFDHKQVSNSNDFTPDQINSILIEKEKFLLKVANSSMSEEAKIKITEAYLN